MQFPLRPANLTPLALEAYYAEMAGRPPLALCPVCGGTGYVKSDVPPGDPNFGKVEHCATCNTTRRAQWLADNCGLTEEEIKIAFVTNYRLGNWVGFTVEQIMAYQAQRKAVAAALNECRKTRTGLYTLWGDYGSGKSFSLQIAVNEARADGIESFYAPFALILTHLRGLVASKRDSSPFINRLLDVPVLAIDEVTRFSDTGWAKEQLFIIIDTRYRRRKSHLTLLATNENPLSKELGTEDDIGYVFSRIRQGCPLELRGNMRQANS